MGIGLKQTERGFRIAIIGNRRGPSAEAAAAYVYREVIATRRQFDGAVDMEEQARRRLICQGESE